MPHLVLRPASAAAGVRGRLILRRLAWRLAAALLPLVLLAPTARAQTVDTLLYEVFDAATPPELPPGWTAAGGSWVTDTGTPSNGSGLNNLQHKGTTADQVTTPVLDLSGLSSATLTYLARRTGSYDQAHLAVTASLDGGVTFPVTVVAAGDALPATDGSWQAITAALPADLLGVAGVVFRFEAAGGTSSSANMRVDDVLLTCVRTVLEVSPARLDFTADVGTSASLALMVTNHGDAAVTIDPPVVTGDAFSILPTGSVVVSPGETEDYTVTFTPEAEGTFEGSVALTFDADGSPVTVPLFGQTAERMFGFSEIESTVPEETDAVRFPLTLVMTGADPLQGLQFTITWDDPVLSFVDLERGAAVADAAAWDLFYEAGTQQVEGVLLHKTTNGLAAGSYAPLLTLVLAAGAVTPEERVDVTLRVEEVIGALARQTGDDAGLMPGPATHVVGVVRGFASFEPSTLTIDFGEVPVDTPTTAIMNVSNIEGTLPLEVSVAGANPLFTIEPASAVVPPQATQVFTITFHPTDLVFGHQADDFVFTHNGEGGPTATLEATGTGAGGRGDAEADGLVDLFDVLLVTDITLERVDPSPEQLADADLYPFEADEGRGDGALDVRDLTVMTQAITLGLWPDDVPLPLPAPAEPIRGAQGEALAGADLHVDIFAADGGLLVEVDQTVPMRGLQLVLAVEALSGAPDILLDGVQAAQGTALVGHDPAAGMVRLLYYRSDGGTIDPGRYALAFIPRGASAGDVVPHYAAAADAARTRLSIDVTVPLATGTDEAARLPEAPALERPYPNPFRTAGGTLLRVPITLPAPTELRVTVYDALGRAVAVLQEGAHAAGRVEAAWDGRTRQGAAAAPGLYLIIAETPAARLARPFIVLR